MSTVCYIVVDKATMENREEKLYIGNENDVVNIEVDKKISNKP